MNKQLLLVPVKFGIVAGILNVILMIILFYSGKHPALLPPYLDSRILVFIIFMYFTLKEYRNYHNEGFLHMWEGLILGFFVYTIVGIIGFLSIIILDMAGTGFINQYITLATEGLMNMREELINGPQAIKMTEMEFDTHITTLKSTTALQLGFDYFIKSILIGFFIPIIYTVFLRKVNR